MIYRKDDSDLPGAEVMKLITGRLEESLEAQDAVKLQFLLLNGILKV